MRYPKLRELKEAVKALIKGPYTARFPYAPHEPFERFRGRPQYHEEDCMGCAACVQVCPSDALSFKDEIRNGKWTRTLEHRSDLCIFCGQCQANCPTQKGIMLTREFDIATTGPRKTLRHNIGKELAVCECCAEPIVPKDQIAWVSEKLGPLAFSSVSVMLFYLTGQNPTPAKKTEPDRHSRFKILCPKCRREAVLKS